MIAWSLSRLQNFDCPERFRRMYITKDAPHIESEAGNYGNWLHSWFDHYIKTQEEMPPDLQEYQPILNRFLAAPGDKHAEYQVCIDTDYKVVGWEDWDRAWFRIIMDMVIVNGDKAIYVDWKSGSLRFVDNRQLALSAAIIFHLWPQVQTISTSFFSTKEKQMTVPCRYDRKDSYEFLLKWMGEIYSPILNAVHHNQFPLVPSKYNCRFCPVNRKNGGDCIKAAI